MSNVTPDIPTILGTIRKAVETLDPETQRLLRQHIDAKANASHPKAVDTLRLRLRAVGLPIATSSLVRCLPRCLPAAKKVPTSALFAGSIGLTLGALVQLAPHESSATSHPQPYNTDTGDWIADSQSFPSEYSRSPVDELPSTTSYHRISH